MGLRPRFPKKNERHPMRASASSAQVPLIVERTWVLGLNSSKPLPHVTSILSPFRVFATSHICEDECATPCVRVTSRDACSLQCTHATFCCEIVIFRQVGHGKGLSPAAAPSGICTAAAPVRELSNSIGQRAPVASACSLSCSGMPHPPRSRPAPRKPLTSASASSSMTREPSNKSPGGWRGGGRVRRGRQGAQPM